MKPRVVVAGLSIVVVALIVAMLWNADERGDVEATHGVVDERVAAVAGDAPAVAVISHRDTVDASVAAPAAAPVQLAFIGRVEDYEGLPLAHVTVSSLRFADNRAHIGSSTTTLADGSFALPTDACAPARLQFVAAECVDGSRDGVIPGVPIVVQLERGIVIQGRAVHADTHEPFDGAQISRAEPDWPRAFKLTGADGRFSIVVRRLPAVIEARGDGYCEGSAVASAPTEAIEIEVPDAKPDAMIWYRVIDRDTNEPIDDATMRPGPTERVGPGLYRAGLAIGEDGQRYARILAPGYLTRTFQPTAAQGRTSNDPIEVALIRTGSVTGRIVDSEGRAIAGAAVVVGRDPTAHQFESGGWFPECETVADASGNFRVDGVPAAVPWSLCASSNATMLFRPVPFVVTAREPLALGELRADASHDLGVRILSAADGSPCVGAMVSSFDAMQVRVVLADANGVAVIHDASRTSFVYATAHGFAPAAMSVDADGTMPSIELRLGRAAQLSGVVRDSAGLAIRDAHVTARRLSVDSASAMMQGRIQIPEVRTDGVGHFAFTDLAPGKYRLFGHHVDACRGALGASGQETVEAETDRADLVLTLATTGTLVLKVASAETGAAVDRVFARVEIGTTITGTSIPNTNGYATREIAARRPFDLRVSAVGFAPRSFSQLVLEPRELRFLEVALTPDSAETK